MHWDTAPASARLTKLKSDPFAGGSPTGPTEYVGNFDQTGCGMTSCQIMYYDPTPDGNCDTNFTDSVLMSSFRTRYPHPDANADNANRAYPDGYPDANI